MSLSIALAIGCSSVGAASAVFSYGLAKFAEGLPNSGVTLANGCKSKVPHVAVCALIGGLTGGALGYGSGHLHEYFNANAELAETNALIVQDCEVSAPEGKRSVLSMDAIENFVCTYE